MWLGILLSSKQNVFNCTIFTIMFRRRQDRQAFDLAWRARGASRVGRAFVPWVVLFAATFSSILPILFAARISLILLIMTWFVVLFSFCKIRDIMMWSFGASIFWSFGYVMISCIPDIVENKWDERTIIMFIVHSISAWMPLLYILLNNELNTFTFGEGLKLSRIS